MAITRSATALLPATDLVAIRTRLSDQYGSELYEADDDRRILCVHVPRAEPDPVNDVEMAVEYLDPLDVESASQVLLIGTQHMAQVYAEPLKQMVADRVRDDHRIANDWRQRLPGTLSHEFFKDPADPRRRSRLVVRLPVESMADVEDSLLEPLADELGPQVDTPRVKGLVAVYLVASQDHVRLAPDLFIQELLRKWRDEDRRMRAQATRELAKQEERERKEIERRRLMAELDRTLGKRVATGPLRSHSLSRSPLDRDPLSTLGRESSRSLMASDLAPGTRLSARPPADDAPAGDDESTPVRHPGAPSHREPLSHTHANAVHSRPDASELALASRVRDVPFPEPTPPQSPRKDAKAPQSEALLSTDEVIQVDGDAPVGESTPISPPSTSSEPAPAPKRRANPIDAMLAARGKGRARGRATRDAAGPSSAEADAPPAERAVADHRNHMEAIKDRVDGLGKRASELHDRPGGRLGRIAQHLMDCGFDVLVRPETPGVRIDLAAERPQGSPQRIVLRVEDTLDVAAADKGLELARTLDVDQVVMVAETAEPEAKRRLLATKVNWLTPEDLANARL